MQTQVVPSLSRWGVSAGADLVFRTLFTFGPWSVDQIGASLGWKSQRVRGALDELLAIGAVAALSPGTGDGRQWMARSATEVVAGLRRRSQVEAAARHRLRERLTHLINPEFVPDPHRMAARDVRPLFTVAGVRDRLAQLINGARREHLAMNPEPAFSAETVKAAAPLNRALHARGMQVRTLGVPPTAEDESGWHTDELNAYGLAFRQLPSLPSKIMLIDRRCAILPIDPDRLAAGAWEITAPTVVEQLVAFFYEHWDRARDPIRDWKPPMDLTPREQAVLALLAKGFTDAAVAAKLEISLRTVAYTISGLMERYQVSNRFQLGLVLGAGDDPGSDRPADADEPEEE
ncbi:response regulator transcription factor [Catellatospora tritici]|uniref:response regulator transcription factor n=1 Tax=Catellatospora tritici TaxID=2851566 RepID=UPI001C2D6AD5|nr:helix-turn-helix transcriptional regulator [Catellatospora tritici]MBV1851301.1 LuxR C-terminal-related transcriptional regulator [Catellatospora tritici]